MVLASVKDGNKNRLQAKDIHKIVDSFTKQLEIPKFSRLVPLSEIAGEKNNYNLNIPRYLDSQEKEDIHDIEGHLKGGIPSKDIDELEKYWKVYPTVGKLLFAPLRDGYLQLKVDKSEIKSTIFEHDEFKRYLETVKKTFESWKRDNFLLLKKMRVGSKPGGRFLYYYLYHNNKQLEIIASGSSQKNLLLGQLKTFRIFLPTLTEQHKIASILSNCDTLIDRLSELIEKRKNINQGVMQELLTGRRRLPGFTQRADLSAEIGDIGYIHYGNIHTDDSIFLDCTRVNLPKIEQKKVAGVPFIKEGDLVMVDASEDYSGIGKCMEIRRTGGRKIVAGLHTFLLRSNKDQLADGFKGYLQFIPNVKRSLIKLATGVSVYGISKNRIKHIETLLPAVEEQSAIARVLSDMDSEIKWLLGERNKYLMIKKAVMQKLLTGEIRLK